MNNRQRLIGEIQKFTFPEIGIAYAQLDMSILDVQVRDLSEDQAEAILIELQANKEQAKMGGQLRLLRTNKVILTFHPASEPPEPDTQILIEWGTEWVIGWYSAGIRIDEPPQGYCVVDYTVDYETPAYMGGGLEETWQLLELKDVKRWAYLPKEN